MALEPDFTPKRRAISNVTVAANAVVTTTEEHGYELNQKVRLHVLAPNPMVIDGKEANILSIIDDFNFTTDYDTSLLFTFSAPVFPPPYTPAHVVPITGTVENRAGPLV